MSIQMPPAIGLVPAAGSAIRLGVLPGSKELLLLPTTGQSGEPVLETLLDRALDELAEAAIENALLLIRRGKWDIPDYLSRRHRRNPRLAYVVLDRSDTLVETVLAAEPFTGDRSVVLVLPDLLLSPRGTLAPLLQRLRAGSADLVLGVFPTDHPERADVVISGDNGVVRELQVKSSRPATTSAWATAAWRPALWPQLRSSLADPRPGGAELHLGHAFQAAVTAGCRVEVVTFANGAFTDVGTPTTLRAALREALR